MIPTNQAVSGRGTLIFINIVSVEGFLSWQKIMILVELYHRCAVPIFLLPMLLGSDRSPLRRSTFIIFAFVYMYAACS